MSRTTAGSPEPGKQAPVKPAPGKQAAVKQAPIEQAPDGRRARWTEHREARRLELIDAAVLAIREYGPNAGMEQIAAAAGTSKPVIYRYFADKADLYRAVVRQTAGALVDSVVLALDGVTGGRETLAAGVRAYLAYIDGNRELYRFVVNHVSVEQGTGDDTTAQTISEYTRLVGDVAAGLLAIRLDAMGVGARYAQPWGVGMVGFVRAAADWWLEHPEDMTRAELADYITTLMWGGAGSVGSGPWTLPTRTTPDS